MLKQLFSGRAVNGGPCRQAAVLLCTLLLLSLTACSSNIDHRGYLPHSGELEKLRVGMSKTEVKSLLGSPSTTATINSAGDSYYYISSVVSRQPITGSKVIDRQVFAVRFDFNDQVRNFAHYGLEDGKIVNFIDRETPTDGREETIIKDFFGNLGKLGPGTLGG